MSAGWRFASVAAALVLVLVALGVPLLLMLMPPYTAVLVVQVDAPARTGLGEDTTLELAEDVRAFVAGRAAVVLPAALEDGRAAFDEEAVGHLDDVRRLLGAARIATFVALALAAAWVLTAIRAGRRRELARSLLTAAWTSIGLVVLAGSAGLFDFSWFFAAFHGLFFEAGTWQFPAEALLINLFPEPFWVTSAIAWGVGVLLMAGLFAVWGRRLAGRAAQSET